MQSDIAGSEDLARASMQFAMGDIPFALHYISGALTQILEASAEDFRFPDLENKVAAYYRSNPK